ncbi:MAG: hypothetical protein WDZ30_01860 [Cellvibrionaceae bacterium]
MKLISHEQRAKVQLRFEIAASALLATILVSTLVVLGTPGYFAAVQQIVSV